MEGKKESIANKGTSRRNFLIGSGVAAGALAVGSGLLTGCTDPGIGIITTPVVKKWDYETDILVIGMGGAGAAAAIAAYDAGEGAVKVMVLEKQGPERHFSNTRMSGGQWHNPYPDGNHAHLIEYCKAMISGENCWWKYEGEQEHVSKEISELYATEVKLTKQWLLDYCDDELNESAMNQNANGNGRASFDTFPSFTEAKYGASLTMGYKEVNQADRNVPIYERPRQHVSGGEAVHRALVESGLQERRPEVEIKYLHRAIELVQRDNGEIVGALAKDLTSVNDYLGDESVAPVVAIKANIAVVLTCGGFEYNVEMRRAFQKGPGVTGWCFYGTPYNEGDGHRMAMKVGAALAKVAKSASRIEHAFPAGPGWEKTGMKMGVNSSITSSNYCIVVDNLGRRYQREDIIQSATQPWRYQFYEEAVKYDLLTMNYQRCPSWCIFDTRRFASSIASGSNISYGYVPWVSNAQALTDKWILTGNTIAQLAANIKAHPENRGLMEASELQKTIERWNEFAAPPRVQDRVDLDFDRINTQIGAIDSPPYYAVQAYPGGPNTKGGIDANAKREVLGWDMKPIPRLYTAGEIASVFKFTYQSGGNVTECMCIGRVAGRNAVTLNERWKTDAELAKEK